MGEAEQNSIEENNNNNNISQEQQQKEEQKAYSQADIDAIANKKNEILNEKKQLQKNFEELQNKLSQYEKNELKNKEESGDYKTLYEKQKEALEKLKDEREQEKQSFRNERLQVKAMNIANSLADGENAELLSEFVKKELDKLSNEEGSLSEDIVEDVKSSFKESTKYQSLLRSSKATGGGASGNIKGDSGKGEKLSQQEFLQLNAIEQRKFIKDGGEIKE